MLQSKLIYSLTALSISALLLFSSCGSESSIGQQTYESTEIAPIKIKRFERDLFAIDTLKLVEQVAQLRKQYPQFFRTYIEDVLAMPVSGLDSLYLNEVKLLLSYPPFVQLQKQVDSTFGDLAELESGLTQAMSIYKAQFPDKRIPEIVTFISEFGYANITLDNALGIGLDMYMNQSMRNFYEALEFPEFMIRKLRYEYILPNTIKSFAITEYEDQTSRDKRFMAMMIVEGKIKYFTKALLPQVHDSVILGYTHNQLEWSRGNEYQMWAHYIDKNLLYNQEPSQFIRYFNDGPFTVADGVPAESAPSIGVYTGWQIVKHYMKNNPSVSLKELMEETDFDKIFKLSKYKPK